MADLEKETVKVSELRHVPRVPMHEGHQPDHPAALLVETLAMVMCSSCSDGQQRWVDRQSKEFVHAEPFGYGAEECDAHYVLKAALDIGVPLYTGAELKFPEDDTAALSRGEGG